MSAKPAQAAAEAREVKLAIGELSKALGNMLEDCRSSLGFDHKDAHQADNHEAPRLG